MYASNCPVSRPIKLGVKVDADFNGIRWSNQYGMVFEPADDFEPIRPPVFRPRGI